MFNMKQNAHIHAPLQSILHEKLLDLFKKFLLVGGMPEAVLKYVQGRGLLEVQLVLDDLLVSVKADFAKYKKKVPSLRVFEVFESVAMQSMYQFLKEKQRNKGIRFSFENFGSVDGIDIYPVYAVQNFVNGV